MTYTACLQASYKNYNYSKMHADSIGHVSFTWIFNHFYNQVMCILCMIYVFIMHKTYCNMYRNVLPLSLAFSLCGGKENIK